MGLDMYLRREIHLTNSEGLDLPFVSTLEPEEESWARHFLTANQLVMYWRKANHIHAWFVDNVMDGEDKCRVYDIDLDMLKDLARTCKRALETQDPDHLPTRAGFFFGSTEIDDWYWDVVRDTHAKLTKLIAEHKKNYTYQYIPSW